MLKSVYALIALTIAVAAVFLVLSLSDTRSEAADTPCNNCGTPRYFCDTWTGGFCDDYRSKTSTTPVAFPAPGDPYSFDAFNTTSPDWQTEGPAPADGLRGLSMNEHFMTVIEDDQFGIGMLRLKQPFDFANREGRIHFDVDLKTGARRYVRVMVSPELTKVLTDDRQADDRRPLNAFDLWFVNGTFKGVVVRNGVVTGGFDSWMNRYYGVDDVRDAVDVYLRNNSIRVLVNGETVVQQSLPDLGFTRGYVYLSQVSYNPCKDGECAENLHKFHWDNVAFDGPKLAWNSLTPAGSRDVLFNAYSAQSCSVKGVPALPVGGVVQDFLRTTWRARVPNDGSSLTLANVSCNFFRVLGNSNEISGFEVVSPGPPPAATPTPTRTFTPSPTATNTPVSTPTPCGPDADGDGLPTCYESQQSCMNPAVNDRNADPDADTMNNASEYLYRTKPCVADTDADGCSDAEELFQAFNRGGDRDPLSPWDVYDVPVPVISAQDTNGTRNQLVTVHDVLAVVKFIGTSLNGAPNSLGVDYDADLNGNGIADGREYDRGPAVGKPHRLTAPDGTISIQDAIGAAAQQGMNCVLPP